MQEFKSSFLREAQWRGFLYQGTNLAQLDAEMTKGSVTAYIGFDATAKSLHIGSLIQIMWLRLLQKHGHKPIILMGDGTTRIGDPSGKDSQRQVLSEEIIDENIISIQKIFSNYVTFNDDQNGAIILRNSTWLAPINYLDFLGQVGRYFSINRMLTFDSVRLRLEREQPLSFLEFNYMILQAYDFLHLNKHFNCILQLGGSDQWGNIINGIDLIKRMKGKEVFGLTSPLLSTADGKKMGKTANGAIWLGPDMLSTYDFWQYWRNVHDQDVSRFLKLFTDLSQDEIDDHMKLTDSDINQVKRLLADHVTTLCRGKDELIPVHSTVAQVYEQSDGDYSALQTIEVEFTNERDYYAVIDLLKQTGLVTSNAEARRLIRGQGARLDDCVINNEEQKITVENFSNQQEIRLSAGRKRHAIVRLKK